MVHGKVTNGVKHSQVHAFCKNHIAFTVFDDIHKGHYVAYTPTFRDRKGVSAYNSSCVLADFW